MTTGSFIRHVTSRNKIVDGLYKFNWSLNTDNNKFDKHGSFLCAFLFCLLTHTFVY